MTHWVDLRLKITPTVNGRPQPEMQIVIDHLDLGDPRVEYLDTELTRYKNLAEEYRHQVAMLANKPGKKPGIVGRIFRCGR